MKASTPKLTTLALALLPAMGLMSFGANADATDTIAKAVKDGKTTINLRYRFESVDQDGKSEDASASTLKTRLTWLSGKANNFSVKLEVDDVTAIGSDNYNSTANGQAQYPVVADPEGTDVNQAFIQYTKDKLTVIAGRQRVLHNDQRFVGGVGWRQNEQTYDGYRIKYNASEALKFDYSYVFNVNRIFGPTGGKADLHGDIHLFTANYAMSKTNKLAFFGYSMDFDTAAGASNNTFGVRYTGKFSQVNVSASYASQSDAGDNPASFDTDYFAFEAGTKFGKVTVAAGYENLGSDNGVGFMTPLATLHKFQGWADKFLGTPGNGVEDFYIKVATKFDKVGLKAFWHNLEASEGGADYGTELDLVGSYKINKHVSAVVKYSNFSSDGYASDTDKLWLMVNAKF